MNADANGSRPRSRRRPARCVSTSRRSASPRTRTPDLDVDARVRPARRTRAACPAATFDGLRTYLFETLGFRGNTHDYGDPENSFLDSVDRTPARDPDLARGRDDGGRAPDRRAGARCRHARSLPRDGRGPRRRVVRSVPRRRASTTSTGCRRLFARVPRRTRAASRARCSVPTDPHVIVARMLANLENGRLASDPMAMAVAVHVAHGVARCSRRSSAERLVATRRAVRSRWN